MKERTMEKMIGTSESAHESLLRQKNARLAGTLDFSHSMPSQWPDHLVGQPGKPVRVFLVDEDPHMRKVIANELLSDLRTDLVAQGTSLREGRRLLLQYDFDVMLVDANLGDGSGLALIEHMKIVRPLAEAIVISAVDDEQSTLRAFELGATGYMVKNSWFGSFPQAVLQVVNGGASITPSLARRLLQRLEQLQMFAPAIAPQTCDKLSEREKGVLKMVAAGYTSIEIGGQLTISCQTVNTHIKNIYRKLQVRTRAQAVSYAAHRGLI
jgi:DNA-binding NarL/FixJ family response regulator